MIEEIYGWIKKNVLFFSPRLLNLEVYVNWSFKSTFPTSSATYS
jgi:hypothetical protein